MGGSMSQDNRGQGNREHNAGTNSRGAAAEQGMLAGLQERHITAKVLTMTANGADAITVEQYQRASQVAAGLVSQAQGWKGVLNAYHTAYEYQKRQQNGVFTSHADTLYNALGASALGQITTDPELIAGSARLFGDFLATVLFSDRDANLFNPQDFDRQAERFVYHANSVNPLPNRSIRETYTSVLEGSLSFAPLQRGTERE